MSKWLEYVTDASTGNVVVWKCPECGEEVETRWKYCPECGDPKTSEGKSVETLIKALEAEHKKLREMQKAQPEIIRCKDCENWDTTWKNDWAKNYHYCPLIDGTRRGDWYCADAERRTDERSD